MFAVAGGKGGCGKTTTTLGLARAAARTGRGVLAVDADADMPDLHGVAGVERDPPLDTGPVPDVTQRAAPGFDVVAAPRDDAVSESDLRRCRGARDVVLVDCPAGVGPDAAVPLRVADETLLVTTLEPASLQDAARTAAMSRAVGTPVVGAVVSRANRVPDGVAELLETQVLGCVPYAPEIVVESAARAAHDRICGYLVSQRD
ncbi:hypothetical protein BRC81_07855 [Halobacteriales archaeon QS_1_68_20]|nr:MAG: hypothetical protein BRC81_07855 [Halobacteriales archaeon QS_1_68_20]